MTYNIQDFGAVPNNEELDTKSIQAAIDACTQAGGGQVLVPPGTYNLGTVFLKSNVELHLMPGSVLLASTNPADYDLSRNLPGDQPVPGGLCPHNGGHMIYALEAENVSITGIGTLHGNGSKMFDGYIAPDPLTRSMHWKKPKTTRTSRLVVFAKCTNVVLRDIAIRESAFWTLWIFGCKDVTIDGLEITADRETINSDGMDIDCSQDVRISNCVISVGDDCIAIFSHTLVYGKDTIVPCENISISNCRFKSSSCGTRIAFMSDSPIRNITFNNIIMDGVRHGIDIVVPGPDLGPQPSADKKENVKRIKDQSHDEVLHFRHGAKVDNLMFNNITMKCQTPFYLWIGKSAVSPASLKNISFSNIRALCTKPAYIGGQEQLPVEGIRFDNVSLTMTGDMDDEFLHILPSPREYRWWAYDLYKGLPYGMFIRNAKNIHLNQVHINWKDITGTWRNAIWVDKAEGLHFNGLVTRQAFDNSGEPALRLKDVKDLSLKNCQALEGTGTFLVLEGEESDDLRLIGNDLSQAEQAWVDLRKGADQNPILESANILK